MITSILIYVGWLFFAAASGYVEAQFFHMVDHNKTWRENIHYSLTVQRFFVWVIIIMGQLDKNCRWSLMFFGAAYLFSFSFIHDGVYYMIRNELDERVYPKGWASHSETSNSIWEFILTPKNRLIGFILSVALAGVGLYINTFNC